MFDITLITMGKLKEKFYISAAAEYAKRLGGYCRFSLLELPESRLPENPSEAEIAAGLEKELEKLRDEDPHCEVVCHFCHTKYQFDLNKLVKKAVDKQSAPAEETE